MTMDMNFCRRCGATLTATDETSFICTNGHTIYLNPVPGSSIFFMADDDKSVILSVRGIEPQKGMLDAFGGFLEMGESFEDAAIRELHEELGLGNDDYEPLQYFGSAVGHYNQGNENRQVIAALYWTRLLTSEPLNAQDDVAMIETVDLHTVELERMHEEDVRTSIMKLRTLFPL